MTVDVLTRKGREMKEKVEANQPQCSSPPPPHLAKEHGAVVVGGPVPQSRHPLSHVLTAPLGDGFPHELSPCPCPHPECETEHQHLQERRRRGGQREEERRTERGGEGEKGEGSNSRGGGRVRMQLTKKAMMTRKKKHRKDTSLRISSCLRLM